MFDEVTDDEIFEKKKAPVGAGAFLKFRGAIFDFIRYNGNTSLKTMILFWEGMR